MKDQFDEISSVQALREECRSLLNQIQAHQRQILLLKEKYSELENKLIKTIA
jgi:hypothetical protein